ncbi:hypothetical protein F5Y15DRAFT_152862 [Xylariaceae sp. FL0016]|nr:hypothetical protein F5Y15DRAFT_152862 [Xylariaceae sp. FL0016]
MAIRYTPDALIHLRESPLCIKPSALPPAEEWMGPPPDMSRIKTGTDRNRNNDNSLLEQTNRRPGAERHIQRNSANPDEIVLGPPQMMFKSATSSRGNRGFENDRGPKSDDTRDRFAFRPRNGDADSNERFRDRDGRDNFRRRREGDQDNDGWSTVKPRKSFGHEGAERFTSGRIGDRFADRRSREQDDAVTDRPRRNFGEFSKEKEGEDSEKARRGGPARTRTEQPWTRDSNTNNNSTNETLAPRERFDRSKSWRERNDEQYDEKPRNRWDRDRDHRQEREPEWLDEPLEEQPQARTQEDFKRFMESMKSKNSSQPETAPIPAIGEPITVEKLEADKAKAKSTPKVEMGTDKFFAAFAQKSSTEAKPNEEIKETAVPASKPKSGSRFQNFFSSQEESRRQHPEPPTPAATAPPVVEINPLLALAGAQNGPQSDNQERAAFQALLQKLQRQGLQGSTPPSAGGFAEPPPTGQEFGPKSAIASPAPYQQYGAERREDPVMRGPPQPQEIHAPRAQPNPQFSGMRTEQQMLQDLIGQRHPSHNSGRVDQPPSRNSNSEFLMTLMQSSRAAPPEAQHSNEPLVMRMPQPSRPAQIPPTPDREPDFQRERQSSQHHIGRPLPSFFDEPPMHHREPEIRAQQPTQILQRPGPPGLEQMPPNWLQAAGQQMPPQNRPMIPPPGLANNPRNPMHAAFPPNFAAVGGFPPEAMGAPGRMAPPPGFFNGPAPPHPGFIPPPGMSGFQGPDPMAFGFDGRGMPPPGHFRRN